MTAALVLENLTDETQFFFFSAAVLINRCNEGGADRSIDMWTGVWGRPFCLYFDSESQREVSFRVHQETDTLERHYIRDKFNNDEQGG